jgi:hypothetical protein
MLERPSLVSPCQTAQVRDSALGRIDQSVDRAILIRLSWFDPASME